MLQPKSQDSFPKAECSRQLFLSADQEFVKEPGCLPGHVKPLGKTDRSSDCFACVQIPFLETVTGDNFY